MSILIIAVHMHHHKTYQPQLVPNPQRWRVERVGRYQLHWRKCWMTSLPCRYSLRKVQLLASDHQAGCHAQDSTTPNRHCLSVHQLDQRGLKLPLSKNQSKLDNGNPQLWYVTRCPIKKPRWCPLEVHVKPNWFKISTKNIVLLLIRSKIIPIQTPMCRLCVKSNSFHGYDNILLLKIYQLLLFLTGPQI